jgi:hypothetical protein
MIRSLRRLVLAALVVGVVGGTAGALATTSEEAERPPVRADGVVAVAPEPPPKPPRPSVGGLALVVDEGSVAVEQRVPDPRGGPDWAVRTFVGDLRRADFDDRSFTEAELVARDRCVQLGRIVDGAFGWVDAQGRFHAVAPGPDGGVLDRSPMVTAAGGGTADSAPLRCRAVDARPEAVAELETLIDDPTDGRTAPVGTVAWGLASGPQTERVVLRGLAGQPREVRLDGRRGAFVAPAGAHVRAHRVTATFDDRRPVRLGSLSGDTRSDRPELDPDSIRLEAKAPDPSGGPAWGVRAARSEDGRWCLLRPARIAGGLLGDLNPELGTFSEEGALSEYVCPGDTLTRKRPIEIEAGLSAGGRSLAGEEPPFGRVALRTLPGTFPVSGLAHPDVRLVTIATERSVRTVAPSPRAGAFLTVFDGDFPAAPIEVIATMADGSTVTQSIETGF